MANETRINLLHLLEDIRDSYALPVEEVIVTELIANALDSGASRIDFFTDTESGALRCVDNGRGMRRDELKEYHNIAATTKERGRGIGFAGIGAKLSLLVAARVITETKGPRGSQAATEWHLANPLRAPWKFIPFSGNSSHPRGTSVAIIVTKKNSPLLDPEFIRKCIAKHFYPILHPKLQVEILRFLYRQGVEFLVNNIKIEPVMYEGGSEPYYFRVLLGRSQSRPVGFGFLTRRPVGANLPPGFSGLAISTYGKIIKRGWEWLGVYPKSFTDVCGLVEIPGFAEILTTNKTDFLNDAASLKKYYRYRKSIQEAVLSSLNVLGEARLVPNTGFSAELKMLSRSIEKTLGNLVPDFPELSALVGVRRYKVKVGELSPYAAALNSRSDERLAYISGVAAETVRQDMAIGDVSASQEFNATGHKEEHSEDLAEDLRGDKEINKKRPGLKIVFEDFPEEETALLLGRMVDERVVINTRHPAWRRAHENGLEEYHVVSAVAWTLSGFLESQHNASDFVSKFLSLWGAEERGNARLFEI